VSGKQDKTASRFVLTADELQAIAAHAITRAFPKNAVILSEGDRTDTLYVILEGRVKIYVADAQGKEVMFLTQGPGEYFGELILDEGPRSASVMTLEPSKFLVVPKADLKDLAVGGYISVQRDRILVNRKPPARW
jgi:CRP/FNR family cyclic AMP-dependent transcriptional regulator